ncbi:ribosome maturation factor RimP [Thomasclavelia cocleata]|jgi:ribosome maturation factor RimP|uniref:Ribosome maturation factor RimP n=1 Tax=Thomasclavelia cocleata TaxID=69824 RepID=A0A829Z9Y8_9FIRM|nr:ribosome maturation factor RimP [Thomasclavelia cocleata]MCI9130403.1 ribosome maturation factor RimP [Thomasclavelia cocleata]MCI9629300.1 ribosome maturation factor RimP [Thomasclavelia cocleata]GFI41350.1 ribosome maturation factor RimP [Thomasclavelia cocleata]
MELLDKIRIMIEPILKSNNVYLDDLEYVQDRGEWYLRIFVEKNEGFLDMDTCVAVSEAISQKMDEEDPIEGEYYLEVSSPGVEKPLKTFEQVKSSLGKYVYAKFYNPVAGLDEVEGFIKRIEDETIEFEYLVKNIKKKIKIDYNNIKFIRLAVKF